MTPQRMTRVLVVENNLQATKTFRKLLSLIETVEIIDFLTTAQETQEMINEIKPDVMLIEEHLPDIDGISFAEIIRRDFPSTQVIIVSQDKQYETVLRALRNGASDFLSHDVSTGEFRGAILRAADMANVERARLHPYAASEALGPDGSLNVSKANVIAVYSPRGGAGVTTIANNLALAFRDNESQIALIDMAMQFGDVDILFNEVGQLSILDLAPIAYDLDSKVVKEVMLHHRSSGLNLMAPPKSPVIQDVVPGEQMSRVIEYTRNFYDYILLNTSSFINDATLSALDSAELIVLVVTQEIASIKSLRLFLEMWEGFGMKRGRLMLALNKYRKNGALTSKKIGEALKMPVDAVIPEDWEAASRAANLGSPLMMSNPTNAISLGIVELARQVKERLPQAANEERFHLYLKNA